MIFSIGIIAVIALILIFVGVSYVKAPPDEAYIISGLHKEPRILIGKAGLRIPFLERIDKLKLSLIPIDIKTKDAVPTVDYINIMVDGIANVKISSETAKLLLAGQNFLNRSTSEIAYVVKEILEGNMREIVGRMKLQDMVTDRQKFAQAVEENVIPDLAKMGIDLVNFNVQNFYDENNLINDLGIDNISKIRKDASIVKARADRDIVIEQAKANEEGKKAQFESEARIAEEEKNLKIKKAQYKKEEDIKQAEADSAYEIQKQVQLRTTNENGVQAEITKAEKIAELEEKNIAIREKQLDAEVRKQADAEKYKQEKEAEAEAYVLKQQAMAKKEIAILDAEAIKNRADAERYKAEQEAEGIKAKLVAEAEGKRAILLAEAEGTEKKAEAQAKMGEASLAEMYFNTLPLVAKEVSQPLAQVKNITMYGDGNTTKLVEESTRNISQIAKSVEDATGVSITDILTNLSNKNKEKKVTKNGITQ